MEIANNLFEINILTENICKYDSKNTVLDKILYLTQEYDEITPKVLISKLNIAKSNLAASCKYLVDSNKLEKCKHNADKRQISYRLTDLGKKELNLKIKDMSKIFRQDENTEDLKKACSLLKNFLNKKV